MDKQSSNFNILVVDDEADFREIVKIQLEDRGYNVSTADNGKEALEIIRKNKFDVVICDIRMPYMDGIELFREVKQSPPPHPRFIFLTAFANYTSDEILASGAAAVLYKPYSLPDLIENIENLRSKILFIEDNKLTSDLTSKRLEKRGFQVVPALDGKTALELLEKESFDLILLDYLLPDMTGFDILKKIKYFPNNSEKPVILLTAETDTNTIVEAFTLGARDYVSKPFEFKSLNARIFAHLNSGQANRDLKVARETALETSKLKSMFLANMGHEIRTPLNGILGTANLLKQTPLSSEQASYVEILESAGSTLMMILNDLLDISKIESGNLSLEKSSFHLKKSVKDSLELFYQNADTKQVNINFFVDESLPEFVSGDPARLRQVLSNLVSNALKFSPSGSGNINIEVLPHENYEENSIIRFEVSDNGIGISEEEQESLFNAFSQASTSTFRKFGGTGLGLSICKQLSSIMGGEIGVVSKKGSGAKFWFTANLEKAKKEIDSPLRISKQFIDKHIKVVVAERLNRKSICQFFENMGFKNVKGYGNCIELISNKIDSSNTDLVITDISSFQDLSVMKKVYKDKNLRKLDWALISFSSHIADKNTIFDNLNVKAELKKPLRYDLTQNKLEFLFQGQSQRIQDIEPSEPKPISTSKEGLTEKLEEKPNSTKETQKAKGSSTHILIVDDEKTNQIVIGKMLEKSGFSHDTASTPEEALEKINSASFDLTLMDFQLPGMLGSDITRIVRKNKNPKVSEMPILALTASRKSEDVEDCIDSGMNGLVEKPTTIESLRDAINEALENYKTRKAS